MLKKYLLFLIIIAIAVSMVMNAMAAMTYVTLTIVNFTTAPTSGARTQMQFVQNSNSPFNITIYNSTYIQEYSEKRTAARTYTAGDLITVGPIDLITAGNYFFNITFDEVVVGGNYYGSCTTDAAWNFCTNCAGSTTSCPSQAGNVLNSNGYAPRAFAMQLISM